jgi:dGTPase
MGKRKIWEKLLSSERLGAGKAPGSAERTAFQQDYDRIVFTSAFRRMKDKTQVFPLSKSDYVRTRLTHSLEASCVGRSLGAVVGREIIARHNLHHVESGDFGAIVAAACLAHDIGNPPFGHAGEDAIREWFRTSGLLERHDFSPAQKADFERYEGNAQGFRIVSRLQSPANPGGLQLTSAVLATFTKYPRPSQLDSELDGKSGKKFGFFQQDAENFAQVARSTGMVERVPGRAWRRHPLAFLVEVADDTCYLIVDMEDEIGRAHV